MAAVYMCQTRMTQMPYTNIRYRRAHMHLNDNVSWSVFVCANRWHWHRETHAIPIE